MDCVLELRVHLKQPLDLHISQDKGKDKTKSTYTPNFSDPTNKIIQSTLIFF